MEDIYFSNERNTQMLIYMLKAYGINTIIASPGATNGNVVASFQCDPYFNIYSCVDERSAAYMAVGMAEETGRPIVLSCTGATSSRNYMPALTEAYYRKLPVIALTSSRDNIFRGHLVAQVTDRSDPPRDTVVESIYIQNIYSLDDEWDCNIRLNRVLQLHLSKPGPVHINMATGADDHCTTKEIPATKIIKKYRIIDDLPEIDANAHIAVYIGSHKRFSTKESSVIDDFCSKYNAVVFCDHTSSFYGNYRFQYSLLGAQDRAYYPDVNKINLLIQIGEVSGDYDTLQHLSINKVWRVSPDGEFRDTFRRHLDAVFEMQEYDFFSHYAEKVKGKDSSYLDLCHSIYDKLYRRIPELPLSNIYVASKLSKVLPEDSIIYLGILNSLRSWNFFELPNGVRAVSNVGGFGIDGILSSLVGASLTNFSKLYFGIIGDLSFFYDMNALGNRHIGNNLRLVIINNGHGQEFLNYNHGAASLGDKVRTYVAAEGHYGNKSRHLVKHYAEDLGFEYMSAATKEEFDNHYLQFVAINTKSIVLEVFTDEKDENEALRSIRNIDNNNYQDIMANIKAAIKKVVPKEIIEKLRD